MPTSSIRFGRASQAAVAAALFAAAAFLAAPRLDSAVKGRVDRSLDSYLALAERATGLGISFESLSPSILRTLSIRGLKARSPRGETILSARRVLVHYDLKAAAAGDIGGAIDSIRIEDAGLSIDADADREILERLIRLFSGSAGGSGPGVSVSGRGLGIAARSKALGTASLAVRDFEFSPRGSESEFSLSGEFEVDQALVDLGSIRGPFSISGRVDNDLSRARVDIGLSARSRDFLVSTQRFEARYANDRIELRKVKDQAALDAECGIDLRDGGIDGRLVLDSYAPERALRASGRYAQLAPWLALPYTGSLSLRLPAGDAKRMSYDLRLAGGLPSGLLGREASAEIAAKGDFEAVEVEGAKLRYGEDLFEYAGSFRFADLSPDGTLKLALSLQEGRLPVRAELRVLGLEGEYAVLADSAEIAGLPLRDLAVAAARRGEQVDFRASFLLPESSEPAPELPPQRFSGEALAGTGGAPLVRCEGSASWGADPSAELSVSLDSIDLEPLRGFLEALLGSAETAQTLSGLRLGGDVFLSSDFKRLSWSAPDLAVVSRSIPDAFALLSLSGNLESVAVSKARLSYAGIELKADAAIDLAKEGGIGFDANLYFLDVPYALRGAFAGNALSLSGDYGLSASLRREGEGLVGSFEAKQLPLPLAGQHFLVSVEAEGRFASSADWALELGSLDVLPMGESLSRIPSLSLSGAFDPSGGQLREIVASDKHSSVSGAGRLDYDLGEKPSCRLVTVLGSKSSPERYGLDLSYTAAGAIQGLVDAQASPLTRFGDLPVSGSLDAKVTLGGTVASPSINFDAALRNGKYSDQALAAAAKGSFIDGVISVDEAQATYLSHRVRQAAGSFSLKDAAAKASFSYSGIWGGDVLSFSLSASGSSRNPAGADSLAALFQEYSAKGELRNLKYQLVGLDAPLVPFNGKLDRSGLTFQAGGADELDAAYGYDGSFALRARAPLPVRFAASGKLAGKQVELDARNVELDLPALSIFFPPDQFRILGGVARGTLRAKGLAADPEISGRLDAEGVRLQVPGWVADEIGPFALPVLADGRKLTAVAPSVPVGKATVSLRAQAELDSWTPTGIKAAIKSREGSQVAVAAAPLGIAVEGGASISLDAEIKGDTAYLSGAVNFGKASVTVSPEVWLSQANLQPAAVPPPLYISVDIDVGLGRGVQVFFPSKDIPIVAGYADRGSALSIRYDEASSDLLLKGDILLRGGDVFYIQRSFFLKNAKLTFNETIDRFDPRVTLLAELRDRTDEGPILISLSANNAHLADFQPRLSSDPTMTEAQIAALLGQNLLGQESSSSVNLGNAVISSTEFIPQLNVTKAFEGRVREALGLDIFYLKTQALQRLAIGITNSAANSETAKANTIGSYLDETTLYAGKYLGDSVFVHGSARLREDSSLLVRSSDLQLDLELGAEFDTPFGLVQWTVAPDSPESLFMRDQKISISWKFAY